MECVAKPTAELQRTNPEDPQHFSKGFEAANLDGAFRVRTIAPISVEPHRGHAASERAEDVVLPGVPNHRCAGRGYPEPGEGKSEDRFGRLGRSHLFGNREGVEIAGADAEALELASLTRGRAVVTTPIFTRRRKTSSTAQTPGTSRTFEPWGARMEHPPQGTQ